MADSTVNMGSITGLLEDCLSKFGFEVHPLKVGWYNSVLQESLHLNFPDSCLAVLVLSTPTMFEKAFLPFIEQKGCQGLSDPIDQCVKDCISSAVTQCFPDLDVDTMYDYELLPSRKPKFLAQTAAHVSGAAYYYQQSNVPDQPWGAKKMFGVCVHPKYGGWFAIRALLVFTGVEADSDLAQPTPTDCVPSREARIQLLEGFNLHWQDWSYRNIIPAVQTYSQKQQEYFTTKPKQRFDLLRSWGLAPKKNEPPPYVSDSTTNGHY
ncbi:cyanocobalamin reductase / alkylcobalamin dealkylase [Neosynchiropus ocellatus]